MNTASVFFSWKPKRVDMCFLILMLLLHALDLFRNHLREFVVTAVILTPGTCGREALDDTNPEDPLDQARVPN